MRTCTFAGLVLCAAAFTVPAAGGKADNLNGTWTPVSIEIDGKKLPDKEVVGPRLVIQGNNFTLHVEKRTVKGTFKADPARTPKTIDAHYEEGGKKMTVLSIYTFQGDTLTVCSAEPGKARPKDFKTAKGDGRELTVYRRQKP
ncbi:MAG: TIGR03067 domain-containing protein [Gemmataceae bacterium]|nr:TIGR03067 domain-containing protein [Gemmataceae bacterium]